MKYFYSPARNLFSTIGPVVSAALLCSAGPGVAAIPAPEKLLPDDTLLVLTMPDFAKVRELYKTAPQTRFWNDPAVKPFKDKFMTRMKEELIEPLERDLGVSLDDYTSLPQGQLTLAVTQNGWHGSADPLPALLLLLDTRDKASQLKTNLAGLRRKWVDAGKSLRTEKIRNLDFTVLPLSDKDIPGPLKALFAPDEEDDSATNQAPKSELVFGQFESLLVAGNSVKAVEKVVAHLTGGSMPALADVAAFEANRLAMFRDAPLYGWVNVKTFVDLLLLKSGKDPDSANPMAFFSPEKIANAVGIGGIKTAAFNLLHAEDGGVTVQFFVGVPEAGRQGLLKLFPTPGKDSGPPPFVPADAVKFQRARLDGQKAWAVLEKIVNDVYPGAVNMFLESANMAAKEQDPDFDVRKNIIGNLGDDVVTYVKNPRGTTAADIGSPPTLVLIGSPRPDALASALKSVLTLLNQGGPLAEREFLGRKIYSLTPPAAASSRGSRRPFNFAASSGYVAMTDDVPLLEEYLRSSDSQQKKLRETPGLADAITRAGGSSTGWFGYENQAETSRTTFEALRKMGAEDADKMLTAGIPAFNPQNPFKEWMDFSLLPPFEKIAKYFYFTVYTGSMTADGLNFKLFSPVPPQLR